MTPNDDPVVRLLSRLPPVTPDGTRAVLTRERCARALDARMRSTERRNRALRRTESIVVGAFSLIYVAAMFADWLRWR